MKPFVAVQNRLLSLWQSTVSAVRRRGRWSEEHREDVEDATAQYAQASFDLAPYSWTIPSLDDVWRRLGDRREARQSGLSHNLALAEFFGDSGLAQRLRRTYRPYEEGAGNAAFWWDCVRQHQEDLVRARDVRYRSAVFGGRLRTSTSVLDGVLGTVARVGVFGDWGTGESVAVNVMQALLAQRPDVLIHLGDIYRSGTEDECERHFRRIIRDDLSYSGPVYVVAGNHDYYSGGEGYYALLDNLNDGAHRQTHSFFSLRNDHWQLLAMDTGHNDCVPLRTISERRAPPIDVSPLRDDEVAWHEHQLEHSEGRRTILFSHHQLCSSYSRIREAVKGESVNPALKRIFEPYFHPRMQPGVVAWLWGHEHDFVAFEPFYQALQYGACLGHGAIPVHRSSRPGTPPYKGSAQGATFPLAQDAEGYFNRGFSMLTLDGPSAYIEHFQVDAHGVALPLGYEKF